MLYCRNLKEKNFLQGLDSQKVLNIESFLTECDITNYEGQTIEQDASLRKYYRIFSNNLTFILMDSSEEKQSVAPFIKIDKFLTAFGLKAPHIYKYDLSKGLMLMEDLGTHSYTKKLQETPELEGKLYELAIEVLTKISSIDLKLDIPNYDTQMLNEELKQFVQWFLKDHFSSEKLLNIAAAELYEIFESQYPLLNALKPTLVLRDYHADNLMYLEKEQGIKKVGILDFQSAAIGSPVYDLLSLLEDARRDVDKSTVEKLKASYATNLFYSKQKEFNDTYAFLSMHRNLKIVGIFHKLFKHLGKDKYRNYLSRVYQYLHGSMHHPVNHEIKKWFKKNAITFK